MGIGKRKDGSFYIICDRDDCTEKTELKSRDFYEASAEARRLGWVLAKTKDGKWVNFCTEFCKTCYFAPQYYTTKKRLIDEIEKRMNRRKEVKEKNETINTRRIARD